MKHSMFVTLILLVSITVSAHVVSGQQTSPPNPSPATSGPDAQALKIRHRLEYLGFGRDVTVKLRHGRDYHGRILDTGDDSFRIDEVDLRKVVSISYGDTKRIDAGYMQKSLIGNTRQNPHTSKIVSLAVLGGLAVFLGVVIHGIR